MVIESVERVTGVGALVVSPNDQFLCITELRPKRLTGKLAGMKSLPMETVEGGESHQEALIRLFQEEVKIGVDNSLDKPLKLCTGQLTPGVWLHAYLFDVNSELVIQSGSELNEIGEVSWMSIEDVLKSEVGNLRFRPGVREVLLSFREYRKNPANFQPKAYHTMIDRVPEEIFDLIDSGLSQREALSRLGYYLQP